LTTRAEHKIVLTRLIPWRPVALPKGHCRRGCQENELRPLFFPYHRRAA
jgi:hypothetical protein